MTNRHFTREFPIISWVEVVAFLTLTTVLAIRLRQHGPLVSMSAAGLVIFIGASESIEFLFGFVCTQCQWSVVALAFLHKSDGWQLGWLIAKLAVVGLFSFGLVRGLTHPAQPRGRPTVNAP